MRKVVWVLAGTALGFVLAHFVSRTDSGRRLFSQADGWLEAFAQEVVSAYRVRDEQLRAR